MGNRWKFAESKSSKKFKEPTLEEKAALELYILVLQHGDNPSVLPQEQKSKFDVADELVECSIRRWIRSRPVADEGCRDWRKKLHESLRILHHRLYLDSYVELTTIGRMISAPANRGKEPDEEAKQKIRYIGQRLWDAGSIEMMQAVFYPVVNKLRVPDFNVHLSYIWSGIGTWRY